MPFQKGHKFGFQPGNKLGRGRPKIADSFTELARSYAPEALKTLRFINGQREDLTAAARAASIILDRAYGKPVQPLTHDVPQDSTIADILRNLPRTVGIPTDKM